MSVRKAGHESGQTGDLGREQLLIVSPELQIRVGRYCDETELLPLLLEHGFVRRVRTIEVEIRQLGGNSFTVTLDSSRPTVGETKVEITRSQGIAGDQQELYKLLENIDGSAVREDEADPHFMADTSELFGGGVLVLAVTNPPLAWRTFDESCVEVSEHGAVATSLLFGSNLITSGCKLTAGRHYWEVELLSTPAQDCSIFVGVSRPDPKPHGNAETWSWNDRWFIAPYSGSLFGNGKSSSDAAGQYAQGDRVGVLVDLDEGSLRYFKNGVQHGPGYPADVTGPIVHALLTNARDQRARLLPDAAWPAGHRA
jgi:hypothetical protein